MILAINNYYPSQYTNNNIINFAELKMLPCLFLVVALNLKAFIQRHDFKK